MNVLKSLTSILVLAGIGIGAEAHAACPNLPGFSATKLFLAGNDRSVVTISRGDFCTVTVSYNGEKVAYRADQIRNQKPSALINFTLRPYYSGHEQRHLSVQISADGLCLALDNSLSSCRERY